MSNNITELINYVNDQLTYHKSQASRKKHKGKDTNASIKHAESANYLNSILKILESTDTIEVDEESTDDLFSISPDEIESMPDDLSSVLNLQETDILESQVLSLLEIAGRPVNLKELIIGLYKKYDHTVKERNPFASKLYRMKEAGLIMSPKKGHYSLPDKEISKNEEQTK